MVFSDHFSGSNESSQKDERKDKDGEREQNLLLNSERMFPSLGRYKFENPGILFFLRGQLPYDIYPPPILGTSDVTTLSPPTFILIKISIHMIRKYRP